MMNKRWVILGSSFLLGIGTGIEFIHHLAPEPDATWEILAIPGSFLSIPFEKLPGFIDPTYGRFWDRMIPPANGVGYAGIAAILIWAATRLRRFRR